MLSDSREADSPKTRRLFKHESHHDLSHLHITFHPDLVKKCARNPLPSKVAQFFYPTHATFARKGHDDMTHSWSSRAHRKHREVHISPSTQKTRHRATVAGKLAVMMLRIEYWNISWWVAQAFTWGSVVWVVNAFAALLPFVNSHFETAPHSTGWTAFLGATIFELGSIIGILEAWNREDTSNCGSTAEEPSDPPNSKPGDVESRVELVEPAGEVQDKETYHVWSKLQKAQKKWIWFSTDTKYFHEMGWNGAFFQLLGASVFWISGFTAIPTIQNAVKENTPLIDGVFWAPQVIGGSGFIISSTFLMLETQDRWWKPKLTSLGWHVGFWNFVGGLGFALSGAFGFSTQHWAMYQSALSTFWGSWAFLIGSVVQWYESVNPV